MENEYDEWFPIGNILKFYPIETAPKDGTRILGFSNITKNYHIVWYSEKYGTTCPWIYANNTMSFIVNLTHWAPLPIGGIDYVRKR